MLIEDQHPHNKSIMLSVLGAPNVGKSSLINYLLGTDLTIVTDRPQTTRNKFHCILEIDHTEIILVDTPGLHKSNQELNKRLNQQAIEGVGGVDINLLLIDLTEDIIPQFKNFVSLVGDKAQKMTRTWVIFTKSDRVKNSDEMPLEKIIEFAKELLPSIENYYIVSSVSENNMNVLTGAIVDAGIPGPHLYTDGEISNRNERFFATEYIREQAFELLKDEIPYEVAVIIDEFKDMKPSSADFHNPKAKKEKITNHISASILVNRPSQRAIVIGSKGEMIKRIGMRSRQKIEAMVGGQVHLNLHVKVSPRWFQNNFVLEEIGLPRAINSGRVWKQKR